MVSVTFYVLWFWSRSAPAPTQGPTSAGATGLPPGTNVSSNKRLQQTQARVDEVSGSRWFVAHHKGADVVGFLGFFKDGFLPSDPATPAYLKTVDLSVTGENEREKSSSDCLKKSPPELHHHIRKWSLSKDCIYEEAENTREILSMNIFVPVTLPQNKRGHWCQFRNSSQSVRLGANVIVEPALWTWSCIPKG